MPSPPGPDLRLRLVFRPGEMVGPGKAELLERIDQTGSIAAAGRAMGMSYKRAWMLVETMNAMFRDPVVISTRGGAQGGGAQRHGYRPGRARRLPRPRDPGPRRRRGRDRPADGTV